MLKITVSGEAGEGKTTVLRLIQKALEAAGIGSVAGNCVEALEGRRNGPWLQHMCEAELGQRELRVELVETTTAKPVVEEPNLAFKNGARPINYPHEVRTVGRMTAWILKSAADTGEPTPQNSARYQFDWIQGIICRLIEDGHLRRRSEGSSMVFVTLSGKAQLETLKAAGYGYDRRSVEESEENIKAGRELDALVLKGVDDGEQVTSPTFMLSRRRELETRRLIMHFKDSGWRLLPSGRTYLRDPNTDVKE